jgi:membrane fusion protein (multidrug efflux system)
MIKRMFLMLLALAVVFGGIAYVKQQKIAVMTKMAATPPPPATIAADQVRAESWEKYLASVGTLRAVQGIQVTSEVAGQIAAIEFRSGQHVNTGDVLLELDASVDKAELQGLIAARNLAELQFKRAEKLLQQGTAVSRSDYDEARGRLDEAEALVIAQRARIAKKTIRAPFSGLLGIRAVDLGQFLEAGDPIVPLQQLDPIHVDYALPERYFRDIALNQRVIITVQSFPDQRFNGLITAINPGIDPGTRNIRIQATFDNPNARLRPGMFAEVRVLLPGRDEVLTVPQTAVTYTPYGDSVFIIEEQNGALTVQRRQVATGEVRGGRVALLSGVKADERVVSAGHLKLRSGMRVVIDNSVDLEGLVSGP